MIFVAPYLWLCQLVAARLGSTALRRSLLTGRTCRKQSAANFAADLWLSIQDEKTKLVPLQQIQSMFRSCVQPSQTLQCFAQLLLPQLPNQDVLDSFAGSQFAGSQLSEQSVISLFRTVYT